MHVTRLDRVEKRMVRDSIDAFLKETLARRLIAAVLIAFSFFLMLCLITFDRNDLPAYSMPPSNPPQNACGVVGAYLAGFMLEWIGVSSFILVIMGSTWGFSHLVGAAKVPPLQKTTGSLLLILSVCASAAMLPWRQAFPLSLGGRVGMAVQGMLCLYIGSVGAWIFAALLFALSAMLLSVDRTLVKSFFVLRGWFKEHRNLFASIHLRTAKMKPAVATAKNSSADAAVADIEVTGFDTIGRRKQDTATLPVARPEWGASPKPTPKSPKKREPAEAEEQHTIDLKAKAAMSDNPSALKDGENYVLPPVSLLDEVTHTDTHEREETIREKIDILERTLDDFSIKARVVNIESGPVVTRYELSLAAGIKVQRLVGLADDIAIATKAPSVRIVAPIPGKSTVGVEIPNSVKEVVRLRELIESDTYRNKKYVIPIFIGKDTSGQPIIQDLTSMPHLLIAGATGSGKSVCINSMIISMLMTQNPADLKLILVDPKMVELTGYEGIAHLRTPVVTDMKRAPRVLEWAVTAMDERYDLLAKVGVRHIKQYNLLGEEGLKKRIGEDYDPKTTPPQLPLIVIIVDEFADMMLIARKEVEYSITRLAQKSRAVGIHIVLATQRPSVDVITGLIKSNMPTRVTFQMTAKVDSRTILDRNGAEALLGSGDMLYLPPGTSDLVRGQGTFTSEEEIQKIIKWIREQQNPEYQSMKLEQVDGIKKTAGYSQDDLYDDAVRVVLENERGSVSLLQRKLEIGYTRAARLVEMMEANGIVGPYKGSKTRELLTTLEDWEAQQRNEAVNGSASSYQPTDDTDEEEADEAAVEVDDDPEENDEQEEVSS